MDFAFLPGLVDMLMALPNTISSKPESPSLLGVIRGDQVYLIGAARSNSEQPFPALGRWCYSVRPDISGAVLHRGHPVHMFLALPETTPQQVQGPSFSPSAGKIFN